MIEDGMMNRIAPISGMTRKIAALAFMATVLILPAVAHPQCPPPPPPGGAPPHGGAIQKSCTSIKRCVGTCAGSPGTACGTSSANCPPGTGPCVAGKVCNSAADCPGVPTFCVGGPLGGSTPCTTVNDCQAASSCDSCI